MFEKLLPVIQNNNTFALVSHVTPDGDTLGSAMALGMALEKLGKKVCLLCDDEVPKRYQFMPWSDRITNHYNSHFEFDVFISIDCSDRERVGMASILMEKAKTTINIDHHISNTGYSDYPIVDCHASATGELIYKLIGKLGIPLNHDMAVCLYVAISTDTGSFCYENTTAATHRIISKLLEQSIDVAAINTKLYKTRSLASTKLIGEALSNLEVLHDGHIAFMYITLDILRSLEADASDCEGVINYGKEIEGVEVAVLIKENNEHEYKVSFRSKEYVDVAKIARYFHGGGHKRASGCTVHGDLEQVKATVLDAIINELRIDR